MQTLLFFLPYVVLIGFGALIAFALVAVYLSTAFLKWFYFSGALLAYIVVIIVASKILGYNIPAMIAVGICALGIFYRLAIRRRVIIFAKSI